MNELNGNIPLNATVIYPLLREISSSWPLLVKFFKEYTSTMMTKVIRWNISGLGSFKCNSDRASKGNPVPTFVAYCIISGMRDLVYAEIRLLEEGTIL